MNLKPFRNVLILPFIIILVGLACQISGGPTPPRSVTISPELAAQLEQAWVQAKPDSSSGSLRVTMTESQVTSYLVYNLKDRLEPVFKNPILLFEPDRIELYGLIHSDAIDANGRILFAVHLDAQGTPSVELKEANFGFIPIPTGLLGDVAASLNKSLAEAANRPDMTYRLQSISLSSGSAVVAVAPKK